MYMAALERLSAIQRSPRSNIFNRNLHGYEQLFSDLVYAGGVPEVTIMLQFTCIWQLLSDSVHARGVPEVTILL